MNGKGREDHSRFYLRIRGTMGRAERIGSARSSRQIRPYVRRLRPRIGYAEQGEERPRKQRLPPECAPVTADTRRHAAAEDDKESRAERPMAIVSDTTRHAGL